MNKLISSTEKAVDFSKKASILYEYMKYKYNKENLVDALNNFAEWVNNLSDKQDKEVIDLTWYKFERLLNETQMEFDDIFGTEGYESTILEKE